MAGKWRKVAKKVMKMVILRGFNGKLRVLILCNQLETFAVVETKQGATSIKISEQLFMQKMSYYTKKVRFFRQKCCLRFEVYLKN